MSRQYLSTKELAAYDQISKKRLGMFHACYLLQPHCAIRGLHEQFANYRLLPPTCLFTKVGQEADKVGFYRVWRPTFLARTLCAVLHSSHGGFQDGKTLSCTTL